MISRFFQTSTIPGKIAVTDAHIAPNKDGVGIVIRKISRKRPLQLNSSRDAIDRKEEEKGNEIKSSTTDFCDIHDENNDNHNDNEDSKARTTTDLATSETRTDEHSAAESKTTESKKSLVYHPRPGDICTIRYDCYLLSPLNMVRDRHGRLRISEVQKFQNRKRKWIDGNFDDRCLSMSSYKADGNGDTVDKPCTSINTNPYGEKDERCKLKLPALEFEIGSGDVIRGLEVVVQRMVEGEIVEATIPHLFAYGYQGLYPRIPSKADLLFVVKLERVTPSNTAQIAISTDCGNTSETNNTSRMSMNNIAMLCCGLLEGTFMVTFGVAIPIFLLLRSELDLEEIIRDLA